MDVNVRVKVTLIGIAASFLSACGSNPHAAHQAGDADWKPTVARPEFEAGAGPVVLVDAAHGNWHTIEGRFSSFAALLGADGYRLKSADTPITSNLLLSADVFVISNPVLGGEDSVWEMPTPSAFTEDEVSVLEQWVSDGGSLLLIADHMPFAGSAEDVARAFGISFNNGYAKPSETMSGTFVFRAEDETLGQNAISRGRTPDEEVTHVKSFTGQAFAAPDGMTSLMMIPEGWQVFLTRVAGEIDETTSRIPAGGMVQGGVLLHGQGRVAVFGEAAMFTAQTAERDGGIIRFGMNDPEADENSQFVLNVMHWLSGRLD